MYDKKTTFYESPFMYGLFYPNQTSTHPPATIKGSRWIESNSFTDLIGSKRVVMLVYKPYFYLNLTSNDLNSI